MSEEAGGLHIPQWTLADRLDKTLRDGRLSTADMAEYLEVHRNTVINWVGGHTKPPASAVRLWAMRVGVPYEWLAHGIDSLPRVDSNHQPAGMQSEMLEVTPLPPTTVEMRAAFRKIIRTGTRIEAL